LLKAQLDVTDASRVTPPGSRMTAGACDHLVQFYAAGDPLATNVRSFLAVPLLRGEAAIVVATPEHRAAFAAELAAAGLDVPALQAAGRYLEMDAAATLATFMTDDGPDEGRFRDVVGAAVLDAVRRFGAVHAYGEMVGLLAEDRRLVDALELEALWSRLMGEQSFRLLCGYPHETFTGDSADAEMAAVHAAHDDEAATTRLSSALDLPLGPQAAALARQATVGVLRAWGLGDDEWYDDARLVVAELVGNAVRHASSRIALSLDAAGDRVTVSVTDGSAQVPLPRTDDDLAEDGRGFLIIDALAECWGVERHPQGKRVWVRLRPPPR